MNLFAVSIAAKCESGGKPVVVSLVTIWEKDKEAVWKTIIGDEQFGLNVDVEGLASLKEAINTAKASELTKEDVYNFVLAVEDNNDIDIAVWDIMEGVQRKHERAE